VSPARSSLFTNPRKTRMRKGRRFRAVLARVRAEQRARRHFQGKVKRR
jgi:hypothetical protein